MKPFYFDYSATTPLDPRVIEKMIVTLKEDFGNSASRSHTYGWQAENLIEAARSEVAQLLAADPREIVWTSGATEANNLAIKGAAHFYKSKGRHIVTCQTEHKAVLDPCRQLEREGFEVTYLLPEKNGILDLEKLKAALRPDTILVSIMHANNEIGVLQDIAAIGALTRARDILLHVDAAQSAGKVSIDVKAMKIDLLSLSAHKLYGPKGIGVLYVGRTPRVRLEAQMHGGGHERGFRSGTLPTHQIVGMGEACRLARLEMAEESKRVLALRTRLWEGLQTLPAVTVNGDLEQRVPGNLNVSFHYVEGESLIMALDRLALSSGSACTSASLEPSYVLRALGVSDEVAHSSLRFGIGRFTTEQEIDEAIVLVKNAVNHLRQMSPLWEMVQEGIDLETVQWVEH